MALSTANVHRWGNLQICRPFSQNGCRENGITLEQIAAACFVAWLLSRRLEE